jgi:hypothetical protein
MSSFEVIFVLASKQIKIPPELQFRNGVFVAETRASA